MWMCVFTIYYLKRPPPADSLSINLKTVFHHCLQTVGYPVLVIHVGAAAVQIFHAYLKVAERCVETVDGSVVAAAVSVAPHILLIVETAETVGARQKQFVCQIDADTAFILPSMPSLIRS